MNAELDPLLNAYLDGELNAPGRRRVERASRSDPAVSGRLLALSRTRDLVATLSSPGPVDDVSCEVLAALTARDVGRRLAWRRSLVAASALVVASAAAALLLMVLREPSRPGDARPRHSHLATRRASRPEILPAPPGPPSVRPMPVAPAMDRGLRAEVVAEETRSKRDRDRFSTLVGRGDLKRIDVTVDRFGPGTMDSVESAIRTSAFREASHVRLRLVQEVGVDPATRGPSCALVLVMDQYEHEKFRRNLDAAFPDAVSEADEAPSRDALLAMGEVGRIEVVPDVPRGTLMPPPPEADVAVAVRQPERAKVREEIVDRRHTATPPPAPADPPIVLARRGDGPAPSGEPRSSVYVVMITARDRARR